MQSQISAIANGSADVPPKVLTLCDNIAKFAYDWGSAFIIVSLFVAVGLAIVEGIVRLRKPAGDAGIAADADGLTKTLDALKGVLEALAKLPVWVAMFLAGFALLWLALEAPNKCPPSPDKAGTNQPAAPVGNAIAANTASANAAKTASANAAN